MVFLLVAVLMAGRYAMFRSFVDPEQSILLRDDVWRMWRVGTLFDLKAAIVTMLPVFLAGLLLSATAMGWRWLRWMAMGYSAIAAFLFTFVVSINYYYYQTYHSFIDIFAFGILDDDQTAILNTIWQDYPVIGIFCAAVIYGGVAVLLVRWGGNTPFFHCCQK